MMMIKYYGYPTSYITVGYKVRSAAGSKKYAMFYVIGVKKGLGHFLHHLPH